MHSYTWASIAVDSPTPQPPATLAQALRKSTIASYAWLPSPANKGDALWIKITQDEYERGLVECKFNLHGLWCSTRETTL